jgi:hypothetical protein
MYRLALRIEAVDYFLDCFQVSLGEHLFFSREEDGQFRHLILALKAQLGAQAVSRHLALLQDQTFLHHTFTLGPTKIQTWSYNSSLYPNTSPPLPSLPQPFSTIRQAVQRHLEGSGLVGVTLLDVYGWVEIVLGGESGRVWVELPF